MSILTIILGVVIGLLVLAFVYQMIATQRDKSRFPAPGQMVDVGGRRLHMNVQGEAGDKPTVILEAGMASISPNWAWVQQELAQHTRVVAYDRAGLGWSDPGVKPLDAAKSARDLHMALQRAGIGGPYVLAGHSYGGLVVRMFADLYPDEVAGLVLVDSSHPDQWINIPASRGGQTVAFGNRVTAFLTRFGLMRVFHLEESYITGLPPQTHAEMRAYLATPTGWSVGADGISAWRDISRQQVNSARSLGDLPLFVLSVTEQDHYAEVLTRLQAELAKLSTNSKHVTVEGATHYTLVSKKAYADIVSDAILQVIEAARTGQPLTQPEPVASAS
ncbi:MAG: alpha/beta fold hydrolase [Anaerolineae bacterium]|nr:alpha/beta fold hydrolase [Anaerolineae bacterium]